MQSVINLPFHSLGPRAGDRGNPAQLVIAPCGELTPGPLVPGQRSPQDEHESLLWLDSIVPPEKR